MLLFGAQFLDSPLAPVVARAALRSLVVVFGAHRATPCGRSRVRLIRSQSLLPGWSIPLVFVVGAISQYAGAAIGVFLFETTEPAP